MSTKIQAIVSVLPSQNIERDVNWYEQKTGFKAVFKNEMYAVMERDEFYLHLQWHADTEEDPLLGGSVIRIGVDHIHPILEEFVERGTVKADKLKMNTPWNTHEFGFYDLNNNAIFIVEGL